MTQEFASIELARLYETQGYYEDALSMYKALEEEQGAGGDPEIRAAIKRLETSPVGQGKPAALGGGSELKKTIAELGGPEPLPCETENEKRISRLLDKWLMLMVVQKRVKLFKSIKARL